MSYSRKDVEKTKQNVKKFVRYQEGAEKYSILRLLSTVFGWFDTTLTPNLWRKGFTKKQRVILLRMTLCFFVYEVVHFYAEELGDAIRSFYIPAGRRRRKRRYTGHQDN